MQRKAVVYAISIKFAEIFNHNLVSRGYINGIHWTASKIHPDLSVQWSVSLPSATDGNSIEQNAILCRAVQKYLLQHPEEIQTAIPATFLAAGVKRRAAPIQRRSHA